MTGVLGIVSCSLISTCRCEYLSCRGIYISMGGGLLVKY